MAKRQKLQIQLKGKGAKIATLSFAFCLILGAIGCALISRGAEPGSEPTMPDAKAFPHALDELVAIEGWVPYWSNEAAIAKQAKEAGFTDLMFFHGTVNQDGTLKLEDPKGLALGLKAAEGLQTWLTVTNHGQSLEVALSDSGRVEHMKALIQLWRDSGCDHLDLDYEGLDLIEIKQLESMIDPLAAALPGDAQLSFTLQPCDENYRPTQKTTYWRMLENDNLHTMRFMAYDYHWKGSLPGALCPMPSFMRLMAAHSKYHHKICMALPLYGYSWPRPNDTSVPKGKSVIMRDVAGIEGEAWWMIEDQEMAIKTPTGHWIAAPSLTAIHARTQAMMNRGVGRVAFWQLGCGELARVAEACQRADNPPPELRSVKTVMGWETWLLEYKTNVCKKVVAGAGDSLASIGEKYGVPRWKMNRFNENLVSTRIDGQTVYVPSASSE